MQAYRFLLARFETVQYERTFLIYCMSSLLMYCMSSRRQTKVTPRNCPQLLSSLWAAKP